MLDHGAFYSFLCASTIGLPFFLPFEAPLSVDLTLTSSAEAQKTISISVVLLLDLCWLAHCNGFSIGPVTEAALVRRR